MLILRNIDEGDCDEVFDALNETLDTLRHLGDAPERLADGCLTASEELSCFLRKPSHDTAGRFLRWSGQWGEVTRGEVHCFVKQAHALLSKLDHSLCYGEEEVA